jgi:hypothetical protein
LTKVKASISALLATDAEFAAGTATDKAATVKQVADALSNLSIAGKFVGSAATFAALPAGSSVKNGDWAALTDDDGANESGIYVKGASGYSFVADITSINEIEALIATDAEFADSLAPEKLVTMAQVKAALSDLQTKANRGGAHIGTFTAVPAWKDTPADYTTDTGNPISPKDFFFVVESGVSKMYVYEYDATADDMVFVLKSSALLDDLTAISAAEAQADWDAA